MAVADSLTTGIDTILAIGPTKNKKEHLVKVISNRNGHIPDEVAITRIIENPYLKHEFVRNAMEGDVLPQKPKATPVAGSSECASHSCKSDKYEFTNEDKKEMAKMKKEGKRLREIADYFKEEGKEISHTTVKKYINEVSA